MAAITPAGDTFGPVEPPKGELEQLFTYHAPTATQKVQYVALRVLALGLARMIDEVCPQSPDRTAAIRKLRECVMTANAAIATGGGFYK